MFGLHEFEMLFYYLQPGHYARECPDGDGGGGGRGGYGGGRGFIYLMRQHLKSSIICFSVGSYGGGGSYGGRGGSYGE